MRVLQIYKDYYPPVVGGIENHINLLSLGLSRKQIHVDVLVSNTTARLAFDRIDGIGVTKVPEFGRYASAPINPTMAYWLRKLGAKADVLHFHLPNPTAVLAYLMSGLRKRIVVTYHSDIIRQAHLKIVYLPFLHRFLRKADVILATSPNYIATSPVLKRHREKCIVAPLGVALSKFETPPRSCPAVNPGNTVNGTPILLFIGKFRHYKGLNVLAESMRKIDARLWLIGSGPLETDVRRIVSQNGLKSKVKFLGQLSDADMIACLKACDILVLPSNYRSEAFGIVQLEAMACSKPVICTELNTGTSFVNQHGKTGLVVQPNSPDAIARAANYLIANPEIARKFGRNGAACVKSKFTSEKMTDQIVSIYRSVT